MKRYFETISKALLALALVSAVAGCSKDKNGPKPPVGGEETVVKVILNISGQNIPATRAMDGSKENEVREIDVLAFRDDGSGNQTFEYYRQGTGISNEGSGTQYNAVFDVELVAGANYDLVFVANAHAVVDGLIDAGSITEGSSKVSVLSLLQFSDAGPWDTGEDSYVPFPMLGETGVVQVTDQMTVSGVDMVRMVAAVDVRVDTPDFTLTNIYLCNYNTVGRIAPLWDAQGHIVPAVPSVPNLPADPGKQTGSYLIYPAAGVNPFNRRIYTFESAAASDAVETSRSQAACLVLEGEFAGENYFYRVDFCDAAGNYMPLLRNFLYAVAVTAAEGPGYSSVTDAIASYTVPSNLRIRVLAYDLGVVRNMAFNGQYMLGVSQTVYSFTSTDISAPTSANKLSVYTDYTQGWEVAMIEGEAGGDVIDWLTLSATSGLGGAITDIYMFLDENVGPVRTAHITLKAGRLTHRINISQQ